MRVLMKNLKNVTNKGFSLVELIIVIAIMAILAAAIAPAVIRYIDKSRHAIDVDNADEISRSMANELLKDDLDFVDDSSHFTVIVTKTGTTAEAVGVPNADEHIFKVFEGIGITNYNPPVGNGSDTFTCTTTELNCKSKKTSFTNDGSDVSVGGTNMSSMFAYKVEMDREGVITKYVYYID
ncbi:MAG: prepilin-type N-terminal cleavage/methylation domain-containing protein [Eubacterium sp.]|jgi:prepilin-type N-terminal cleavage/methylation domain-containing protein|nr:prepilin-type N-terminal cleavage/methylation domain-containing protein [Eubacterium sp.]